MQISYSQQAHRRNEVRAMRAMFQRAAAQSQGPSVFSVMLACACIALVLL